MTETTDQNLADQEFIGWLAQFEDPDTLVAACDAARQAGYTRMDAFSPFPVHGIDPAIGIRRTALPFIVLAIGITGCAVGLFMQYYANAVDWTPIFPGYAFKISGKPYFSIPANIPVTFEFTILSSAFGAFFGMWALNRLPRLANPLHRISRFKRATNDKFFLLIQADDEKFDRATTKQQLQEWNASAIEEVNEDLSDQQMPHWVQMLGLFIGLLMLVPPVLIFRAQGMTNERPRLHIVPDMDWQDKLKTQVAAPNLGTEAEPDLLFTDFRGMRPPIPGTIPRGGLHEDSEYYRGIQAGSETANATVRTVNVTTGLGSTQQDQQDPTDSSAGASSDTEQDAGEPADAEAAAPPEPEWIDHFPSQVTVDRGLLDRGRQRFEIYCTACHGYAGNGDGLVNARALSLAASGQAAWTAAKSLHDPEVIKNPVGRIFDTISNGRGTMGPYGSQIPVADRWAIVAYVKALQETGIEPPTAAATDASGSDSAATDPSTDE